MNQEDKMEKSITNVITFEKSDKIYILFKIKDDQNEYLYISSKKADNRSVLFGENLESFILLNKDNEKMQCLECQLGNKIQGGVSLDGSDTVESNLNVAKANSILLKLKSVLKNDNHYFKSIRPFH